MSQVLQNCGEEMSHPICLRAGHQVIVQHKTHKLHHYDHYQNGHEANQPYLAYCATQEKERDLISGLRQQYCQGLNCFILKVKIPIVFTGTKQSLEWREFESFSCDGHQQRVIKSRGCSSSIMLPFKVLPPRRFMVDR